MAPCGLLCRKERWVGFYNRHEPRQVSVYTVTLFFPSCWWKEVSSIVTAVMKLLMLWQTSERLLLVALTSKKTSACHSLIQDFHWLQNVKGYWNWLTINSQLKILHFKKNWHFRGSDYGFKNFMGENPYTWVIWNPCLVSSFFFTPILKNLWNTHVSTCYLHFALWCKVINWSFGTPKRNHTNTSK